MTSSSKPKAVLCMLFGVNWNGNCSVGEHEGTFDRLRVRINGNFRP